jgi:hypothetical protein
VESGPTVLIAAVRRLASLDAPKYRSDQLASISSSVHRPNMTHQPRQIAVLPSLLLHDDCPSTAHLLNMPQMCDYAEADHS